MSGGPQRLASHSTLGLLEVGLLEPEPASIAGAVVGIGSLGGGGALVGGDELVWGLQAANASTNTNDILPDLTSGIVVQLGCSMPAVSEPNAPLQGSEDPRDARADMRSMAT